MMQSLFRSYSRISPRLLSNPRISNFRWQHNSSRSHAEMARLMLQQQKEDRQSAMMYVVSAIIFMTGAAYAAVPIYKLVCATTGFDGSPVTARRDVNYGEMRPVSDRPIRIHFNADVSNTLGWIFKPQIKEVVVQPGETALTFFTAKNPTPEDVIGISTYSVVPGKAAQYFNKIQCFCFEEQKLLASESVDMPVFFFIDPEFAEDPLMKDVKDITLSYTFFRSKGT